MEISPFTVYLWQQADSFNTLFQISATLFSIVSLVLFITSIVMSETSSYKSKQENEEITAAANSFFRKKFLPSFAVSLVACLLTASAPSTKTIAVMYAVPAIVNSKPVQQDLPELYQMGVEALKAQLAPKPPAKLESPTK